MKISINNNRGFTLLELMHAMVIGAVIVAVLYGLFECGNRLWRVTQASLCEDTFLRIQLGRDLRGAWDMEIDVADSSHLMCSMRNPETLVDETVHYEVVTPEDGLPYLQRRNEDTGDTRRVANDVTDLTFTIDDSGTFRHVRLRIDVEFTKSVLVADPIITHKTYILALRNTSDLF